MKVFETTVDHEDRLFYTFFLFKVCDELNIKDVN